MKGSAEKVTVTEDTGLENFSSKIRKIYIIA